MEQRIHGYTRDELLQMDAGPLRAILHERTHHTIEVLLYRILNGKLRKPPNFGLEAKTVLAVWEQKRLPTNTPDLEWCRQNIEIADKLNAGETVKLDTELPRPFSQDEMEAVRKLLYERRTIRQFAGKPIPDSLVREILYAGLMAPQGCNVDSRRFIVLSDPAEWKLVRSDIPIENAVMILVCQDMRAYQALRFDQAVPQNIYYDAAAAADHMCLMASALGLGACWLTHGEETQTKIREYYGLPSTVVSRLHIIVGWPDEAPIKSKRMSLDDAILKKPRK